MCFSPRQLADSEYAEIVTLSHATLSHKITAAVWTTKPNIVAHPAGASLLGTRVADSLEWYARHARAWLTATARGRWYAGAWLTAMARKACGWVSHCNGTHGMRTRDSSEWHARNVENAWINAIFLTILETVVYTYSDLNHMNRKEVHGVCVGGYHSFRSVEQPRVNSLVQTCVDIWAK